MHAEVKVGSRRSHAFLAAGLGALLWVALAKADRLNRNPLDFRTERTAPRPTREELLKLAGAPAPSDTVVGTWTLQPRVSFSEESSGGGLALSYVNKKPLSALPFNASVTGKAIGGGPQTLGGLQLYGELDPDLSGLNPALSLAVAGEYDRTATVGAAYEGSAELDFDFPNAPGFSLGVIGYIDEDDPISGPVQNGATAGLTADWKFRRGRLKGRAEAYAEYDFKSDFAGEDNFVTKALYTLYQAPKVVLIGGFQKHNNFLVALKTSFIQANRP